MAIIEEEGGRLNTFAKEPKIQLISTKPSGSKNLWLLGGLSLFILLCLIAVRASIQ